MNVSLPEVLFEPLQLPLAEQEEAFELDQEIVKLEPVSTSVEELDKETVGVKFGAGVESDPLPPPPPPQETVSNKLKSKSNSLFKISLHSKLSFTTIAN